MEVDFVSLEEDNLIVVFVCVYKLARRIVTITVKPNKNEEKEERKKQPLFGFQYDCTLLIFFVLW